MITATEFLSLCPEALEALFDGAEDVLLNHDGTFETLSSLEQLEQTNVMRTYGTFTGWESAQS